MAFEIDITTYRNMSWGGVGGLADLVRLSDDWSGAAISWVFADGVSASQTCALSNAEEGVEGVSLRYDSGYLHPRSGEVAGATIIRPQIDEDTIEALGSEARGRADCVLKHTLYVTPIDQPKRIVCFGTFTIKHGVVVP